MEIRGRKGLWIFTICVTVAALIGAISLFWFMFPTQRSNGGLWRTCVIVPMIAPPIAFFVARKIRENTLLADELQRLVDRDRLTDVATRDFFFDRMERDPEAYGVSLMVDIDHFKEVNDTHGHLVGDDVIKMVGNILRKETRAEDIVCRFGGEEFVIFLHEADGDKGLLVAERMRMSIEASNIMAGDEVVSVTVSIGGSIKERLEDINVSIKLADEALYRAKQSGRNRTVVDWMPSGLNAWSKAS